MKHVSKDMQKTRPSRIAGGIIVENSLAVPQKC